MDSTAYVSTFYFYLFQVFKQVNKCALHATRPAGCVCSHYWKGVILQLRVLELQLYTIINFCLVPIRFHSTLDVSTATVDGSRLAIQHVLSCQSTACLGPTTRPINSYWLWHTCPSKMSSSVLIFPESCSLPPLLHPFMPAKGEIFILTDCVRCVVLRPLLFCGPTPLQTRQRREQCRKWYPLSSLLQFCNLETYHSEASTSSTLLCFTPSSNNQVVKWSCMIASGGQ